MDRQGGHSYSAASQILHKHHTTPNSYSHEQGISCCNQAWRAALSIITRPKVKAMFSDEQANKP
jgi:hypothetical protein